MAVSITNYTKQSIAQSEVDFVFSDDTDFVFSDDADYVFVEATSGITNYSKA